MNRRLKWGIAIAAGVLVCLLVIMRFIGGDGREGKLVPVEPVRGDIELAVSTVGTIKPQNRLEIKPPIGGRIEKILVVEGQEVKVGEVLALMSSTERATLIDAARLKGKGEYDYWRNAYKETPLIAPIDGVVIVRDVEPGQTITTATAVLVLSDRLIVEADVDETDIGELKLGQEAMIKLDAYPQIKIDAVVDHISYESQVISNVTIYKVDILPKEIPDVFRSGMSANVDVKVKEAVDVLLIPSDALLQEGGKTYVMVKNRSTGALDKKEVETGLENEGVVEIRSGISEGDVVYAPKTSYAVPTNKNGGSPFFPQFRKKEDKIEK
jgi:macrolide-specific efflux system membrane fusion protein